CLHRIPPPPSCTLFPYTTLFRSGLARRIALVEDEIDHCGDRRETLGALDRARRLEGHAGAGDACLRPCDALLHRALADQEGAGEDRKSTRLNSSHVKISYAVFCL